jgi:hypothetical protein
MLARAILLSSLAALTPAAAVHTTIPEPAIVIEYRTSTVEGLPKRHRNAPAQFCSALGRMTGVILLFHLGKFGWSAKRSHSYRDCRLQATQGEGSA